MRCLLQVEHFGVFLAVHLHFSHREGWDSIRLYIMNILSNCPCFLFFSCFADAGHHKILPPIDVFLIRLNKKYHTYLFHSPHSFTMCESIEVLNTSRLLVWWLKSWKCSIFSSLFSELERMFYHFMHVTRLESCSSIHSLIILPESIRGYIETAEKNRVSESITDIQSLPGNNHRCQHHTGFLTTAALHPG